MHPVRQPRGIVALCLSSFLWVDSARAADVEAAAPADAGAAEQPAVDPDALGVLRRFGEFLAARPSLGFSVEIGYEVVQDDGEKLEFGSMRRYVQRRPDRLRIDEERRVGGKRSLFFDGDRLAVWIPDERAYALANLKTHRTVDDALDVLPEALDIEIPLGELLRSRPAEAIEDRIEGGYVVGREQLGGRECDHLAIWNSRVDAELWVATGPEPLPQRVTITYREHPGEPRFWARFYDWAFDPDVSEAVFAFEPPEGAERVPLSVRAPSLQRREEEQR
jgi:hypothetical protein